MAILSVKKRESGRDRELEIKEILGTLELDFEAEVSIEGKITQYRTSFEYYRNQYNSESGLDEKKYSFSKTNDPKIWKILRIK